MTICRNIGAAAAIALAAGLLAKAEVWAGADQVAFPENWAKGVVYMQIDRPNNKQLTEYYVSQDAIEAAKKGMPLPSGTVIAAVAFAARLDGDGNPVKDASGKFVKTGDPLGYRVMEKRTGWGADYPADKRNGEWEYRVFRADKNPNPQADLDGCFGCHKPQDKLDFVFTYDKLKLATN
jgi:hypothetical protein